MLIVEELSKITLVNHAKREIVESELKSVIEYRINDFIERRYVERYCKIGEIDIRKYDNVNSVLKKRLNKEQEEEVFTLRSNIGKDEVIQQILNSGIELNTQAIDKGVGTKGRPAITRNLKKELDKFGVAYTQRDNATELKRKLDAYHNQRKEEQVDLNKLILEEIQARRG